MNTTNTIIVILAAGEGNRMGMPKWKLPFNSERNFLEHLVFTYSGAGFSRIAVVMTHDESEKFHSTAAARKCKTVINSQPRSERNHSVRLGLAAFRQYEFAFIQNVDNPFTTAELIIEMWHGRLSNGFVVPAFGGKPGHPVLLGRSLCREFLRHKSPDLHFRTWLYSFPKRAIEGRSPRILQNINTLVDLKEAITEFSLPEKFKSVQDFHKFEFFANDNKPLNTDMESNELAKRISHLAEKYSHYTASNLSELVKVKSLSGGEGDVQKVLMKQMTEAGFDEVKMDGLGNVIGRIGNGPVVLAIDGHIDTVDVGNMANWDKDPFSGEISDGFVWGRGTVDQKGGVASFVTAGRILKEIGVPGNITLYCTATVMEEDCDGLCWKYLIEEEGLRPHFAISTEPTNLNVYRGHRGRMEIRVSFRGVSAHGSAPERGKNAIYMASRAALEIEKLNERLRTDDFLGKGTVTISEFVSGSPSLCAVADYAHLHLDRRLTWGETKESAVAEVAEALKGLDAIIEVLWYDGKAFTGKEYGMEKYYPTWKIDEKEPIVVTGADTFRRLFNREPLIGKWTFSTNGISINGLHGIPTIGFGPGNEVMAHAPNEKTPVNDLVAASAFYALFAYSL